MAKRISAFLLSVLLLTLCFAGCGKKKNNTTTSQPDDKPNQNEIASKFFKEVVMKIGDIEITYETYRYLYMSCRTTYEKEGITKTVDEIKAEVLSELFYESAVQTLINKYGTDLTAEQKKAIDDQVATLVETYKDYGYELEDALATRYMTTNVYRFSYAFETYMTTNVYEYCKEPENEVLDFSEDAILAKMKDYNRALMIYVGINETRNDENAKKKIDGVMEKLNFGEDFAKIATEYSDNLGTDPSVGLYFKSGDMEDAIEKAYNSLAEGEYTKEAVKAEDGYYIIYRISPDAEYFSESLYPYYAFNDLLQSTKESLLVTYTDFFTTMFDGKDLIPERAQ